MKKCPGIIKSFCIFSLILLFVFVLIIRSSYGDNLSSGDSENNTTIVKICAGCGDNHKNTINIENDLANDSEVQNIARAKVQIIVVFLFLVLFIFLMTRPSTKIQHMIDEIDDSLKKL